MWRTLRLSLSLPGLEFRSARAGQLRLHGRIGIVDDLAQKVAASEAGGGPGGMSADDPVAGLERTAEGVDHARIAPITGVAEDDERIAAEVPRVSLGDVPPSVGSEQFLIARGQKGEQIDGGLVVAVGGWRSRPSGRFLVDRTGVLAVVTAIEPIAQRDPMLGGEDARRFEQP